MNEMQRFGNCDNHLDEDALKVTDWLPSVVNYDFTDEVEYKYKESKGEL